MNAKDYSVKPRTSHQYDLGTVVFDKQKARQGIIVGYAGPPQSPSYCVQFEGDPGMHESMPFRYISENELSSEPVTFAENSDEIIRRLQSGEFVANRELDLLVERGLAVEIYDDSESNAPTHIRLIDHRDIDGNEYTDQADLEEKPGRL